MNIQIKGKKISKVGYKALFYFYQESKGNEGVVNVGAKEILKLYGGNEEKMLEDLDNLVFTSLSFSEKYVASGIGGFLGGYHYLPELDVVSVDIWNPTLIKFVLDLFYNE